MDDSNIPGLAHDGFDPDSDLMWLVQQCQDGDQAAIAALVERYFDWMRRICGLLVLDRQQADRCMQEGFASALLALGRYHGKPDFRLWLARFGVTASRRCNQQVKASALDELQFSLATMQAVERETILLHHALDLTVDELAVVGETTPERVEALLNAGHDRLAQAGSDLAALRISLEDRLGEQHLPDQHFIQHVLRLRDERKRKQRFRLGTFELVWVVLGILLLAGTVRVIDLILPAEVETPVEVNEELVVPPLTPEPSLTPTPTLLPYEETQANAASYAPAISGDGRFVAFTSEASNLTPGDTNGYADVFLFDRQTVALVLLSIRPDGEQANGPSGGASLSADGRFVTFVSWATNLVDGVEPACEGGRRACAQVYLLDRQSGELRLLSQVRGAPGDGDSGMSGLPAGIRQAQTSISGDGSWVAFASLAGNLTGTPSVSGVLLVNTRSGDLRRVDRSHDGRLVDGHSTWATLSQDGRFLAFQTLATNLVTDDTNQAADIYLYDIAHNHLERVTLGREGTGGKGPSLMPSLSGDGRLVAFRSGAWDLGEEGLISPGSLLGTDHVYLYDREQRRTELASATREHVVGNGHTNTPALSADGQTLIFACQATNLVDADVSTSWDIYLKDLESGALKLLSTGISGGPALNFSHSPAVSADGQVVVFVSHAANLVEGDANAVEDIFLYDREGGSLSRINLPYWVIQE
jgi:Tol biopolymer transport system component/DNA-directed RNA polymerase specialized sigma24 family protein